MLKKYVFYVFLNVFFFQLTAKQVEVGEALSIAEREIRFQQGQQIHRSSQPKLTLAYTAIQKGTIQRASATTTPTIYYVFNVGSDNGYVIISGDDIANPVLGYTNSGSFDKETLPPNLFLWLENIQQEITDAIAHGAVQDTVTKEAWKTYLTGEISTQRAVRAVSPLIKTQWGQASPYNDLCPLYSGNKKSLSGCVATVMAQIMKYYGYPQKGSGTCAGYSTPNLIIPSINISQTTYNWSAMTNTYNNNSSTQQKSAVATLMYHCGVSVKMNYGDESGAFIRDVPAALVNNFGYDKSYQYRTSLYYTAQEWNEVLKKELDERRPVIYGGTDENGSGGHAFICDGYDTTGKFHINWGWDGRGDGFYAISALNVFDYRYNKNNYAITGIKPNENGEDKHEIRLLYSLKLDQNTVNTGSSFKMPVTCVNLGLKKQICYFGIVLVDKSNDQIIYREIGQSRQISFKNESMYTSEAFECVIPEDIALNKQYALRAAIRLEGQSEWEIVRGGENCVDILPVTILHNTSAVKVSISPVSGPLTVGESKQLTAKVTPAQTSVNNLTWKSNNTSIATVSSAGLVTAKSPGTVTITATAATSDGNKTGTISITVIAQSVSVSGISLIAIDPLTVGDIQQVSYTISPWNATNKEVTWKTSNPAIATVSTTGVVTAKSAGSAMITATTKDSNKSQSITVTVTPKKVPVSGITLTAIESLTVGAIKQIPYTVSPWNATNKEVIWKTSNSAIVTVSITGVVTAQSAGSAAITATTKDGNKSRSIIVTITPKIVSVSSITLTAIESLTVGAIKQIPYTVSPWNATNKEVIWKTSNSAIVTVSTTGVVTAKSAGTASVTATTKDGNKSQSITVTVIPQIISVSGISLTAIGSLTVGDIKQVSYSVSPWNATNKEVTWKTSNSSIATISTTGVVTAKSVGTATITATTRDGNKSQSSIITIIPQIISVSGINLTAIGSLTVGDIKQVSYTVSPWNATNKEVTWKTSNSSIATVSVTGAVTAKSVGTATITATTKDGNKSQGIIVTVTPKIVSVSGISLTAIGSLTVGDIKQVSYTVSPWNATNKEVTWKTSNSSIATVSVTGAVTAKSVGTASISATTKDGNKSQSIIVTVTPKIVSVSGISLTTIDPLTVGDIKQIPHTVSPWNATNKEVTWKSYNESVATVSTTGTVTARSVGKASITATTKDGNKSQSIIVSVTTSIISVSGISLTTVGPLTVGDIQQVSYTVSPWNATNKEVTWKTSNSSIAAVSTTGMVTARSVGTAAITATTKDGNKSQSVTVTVTPKIISVTGISLTTIGSLTVGDIQQVSYTVSPWNATNKEVTWKTSNSAIATVSATGMVTAKSAGTAAITATTQDGNKSQSITVTIIPKVVSVSGINLTTIETLTVGDIKQIPYTVSPWNATNKEVTWKSYNESVATVNATGMVIARGVGAVAILATTKDGNKSQSITINVITKQVPVTGISLNPIASLSVGTTHQAIYVISPWNATTKTVTWKSSNESIATVSTAGLVTAKSAGTVTITATTDDGKKAGAITISVIAKPVPVSDISLNVIGSLRIGDTRQITYTILPLNASNKDVTWKSSNESIATVSATGLVTAKNTGTATITATTNDGYKIGSSSVGVVLNTIIPVTKLALDFIPATFDVENIHQLTYTIWPVNATNQNVTWNSSDKSVATVSATGLFIAKSNGTTTITVTDGNFESSKLITVKGVISGNGLPTGNEDKSISKTIAYPNPSTGLFMVKFNEPGTHQLTVTNLLGKTLIRETTSDAEFRLDMTGYTGGVYLLVIEKDNQRQTLKIVLKP